MMESVYSFAAASFVLTLALTWFSIKRLRKIGLVAEDLHKKERPKRPKIGGVAIAGGFGLALMTAFLLTESAMLLMVLAAFLAAAAVGLADDLRGFTPLQKLVLGAMPAVPLLWFVQWHVATVLLLFIAVGIVSNWTNMLAGFNGLEIGMGFIAVFFLGVASTGTAQTIMLAYAAALFAFLLFNKYPAKVFPGDVGTMPIGVMLVAGVLLGAPWTVLCILMLPYFVDMCLKLASAGVFSKDEYEPSRVDDGRLRPGRGYLSLAKVVMKIRPMKEWQLVTCLWLVEIGLGLVAIFV